MGKFTPSNSTSSYISASDEDNTANLYRAEDVTGNTLFTACTADKPSLSPASTLRLQDATSALMYNSTGIKSDWQAATISAQVPGSPLQHFLITIEEDHLPYCTTIDMGLNNHGSMGEVVTKNTPLFLTSDGQHYGRAMAMIDDRSTFGRPMLYLRRYSGGTCQIVGIDLGTFAQGVLAPVVLDSFDSADPNGTGEMQVSADGGQLAIANQIVGDGYLGGGLYDFGKREIRRYSISSDHTQLTYLDEYADDGPITGLDFSPGAEYIYFVQTRLMKGQTNVYAPFLMRTPTSSMPSAQVLFQSASEVRRTAATAGQMVFTTSNQLKLQANPNATSLPSPTGLFTTPSGETLLPNMALQPLIITGDDDLVKERTIGDKHYELTDHLGNVRATVSDKRLADWNGTALQDYRPELLSHADYYAFGSLLPGRNYSTPSYNFGFNGQLKDQEICGEGNSYDFGFRAYDPRIGRFLSLDPVGQEFPFWSPYHFAANSPIWCMDWDGLQPVTRKFVYQGTTHTFRTTIENPQKFKLDGSSYDFMSTIAGRNKNSLALLKGGHSRQLRRSSDVKKMAMIHRGVMVNDLLLSVLEQHPDIGLVIIGNHNVPTSGEIGPARTARGEADLKDIDGNVVFPAVQRDRNAEIIWTRDRAKFIQEQFFHDSGLVGYGSVAEYRQIDFPNVLLRPLGNDAVGITITFDLHGTIDDNEQRQIDRNKNKPDRPKDNTEYHNPRFL